ncbi:MAG: hypothetical protein K8F32_08580 [Rhodocyclaceae bacterium]|nr:hypothetical protein [Rhodocyclaceae bacterium]
MQSIQDTKDIFRIMEAAIAVLDLIQSGEIASDAPEHLAKATSVADRLQAAVERLRPALQVHESPFLAHRKAILGGGGTARKLADLTLHLFNEGHPVRLGSLLRNADEEPLRIALECIAGYAHNGERDPHFMRLAREILDLRDAERQQAA